MDLEEEDDVAGFLGVLVRKIPGRQTLAPNFMPSNFTGFAPG
jgi:hypothetical protein